MRDVPLLLLSVSRDGDGRVDGPDDVHGRQRARGASLAGLATLAGCSPCEPSRRRSRNRAGVTLCAALAKRHLRHEHVDSRQRWRGAIRGRHEHLLEHGGGRAALVRSEGGAGVLLGDNLAACASCLCARAAFSGQLDADNAYKYCALPVCLPRPSVLHLVSGARRQLLRRRFRRRLRSAASARLRRCRATCGRSSRPLVTSCRWQLTA